MPQPAEHHRQHQVRPFHAICLGWPFFRTQDLEQIGALFATLAAFTSPADVELVDRAGSWLLPFAALVSPLVLIELSQHATGDRDSIERLPGLVRVAVYATLLPMVVLLGDDGGAPFVYFQF